MPHTNFFVLKTDKTICKIRFWTTFAPCSNFGKTLNFVVHVLVMVTDLCGKSPILQTLLLQIPPSHGQADEGLGWGFIAYHAWPGFPFAQNPLSDPGWSHPETATTCKELGKPYIIPWWGDYRERMGIQTKPRSEYMYVYTFAWLAMSE